MRYDKTIHTFKSHNGLFDISYYLYQPILKPIAVLQISHGMCEYIERYEHFIHFMTNAGVVVTGHDHAGHGFSINSKKDLATKIFRDLEEYVFGEEITEGQRAEGIEIIENILKDYTMVYGGSLE